jgi:hypothetical protein
MAVSKDDFQQSRHDPYEDELNESPDTHFLSPMQLYEYEDWADDSEDESDNEEVVWNAGITDFALFDRDRRNANEHHQHVPGKWQSLLDSQASALQRAVERNQRGSASEARQQQWTPLMNDLPQLTPDHSPNLHDDFEMDTSFRRQGSLRPRVPDYLHLQLPPAIKTSSDLDDAYDSHDGSSQYDDDENACSSSSGSDSEADVPVAALIARARERRMQYRKLERPGLRYNRTMSGKVHAWRRPSVHIYPLGEEREAEAAAE